MILSQNILIWNIKSNIFFNNKINLFILANNKLKCLNYKVYDWILIVIFKIFEILHLSFKCAVFFFCNELKNELKYLKFNNLLCYQKWKILNFKVIINISIFRLYWNLFKKNATILMFIQFLYFLKHSIHFQSQFDCKNHGFLRNTSPHLSHYRKF